MKKILSLFCIALLLISMLFILTACDSNNGEKVDPNIEKVEIIDEYDGLKVSFSYSKDSGITAENISKTNRVNYKFTDDSYQIDALFLDDTSSNMRKSPTSNGYTVNDFEANGLKGIFYVDKNNTGYVIFDLIEDKEISYNNRVIRLQIKDTNKENPKNSVETYIASEKFIAFRDSIKFEKLESTIKGEMNSDRTYGVDLKAPEGYTIKTNHVNDVEILFYKEALEKNVVSIKIRKDYYQDKTLEELVDKEKEKTSIYTGEVQDVTYGDYSFKNIIYKNAVSNSWSSRESLYVEKDGIKYSIDYMVLDKDIQDKSEYDKLVSLVLDAVYLNEK